MNEGIGREEYVRLICNGYLVLGKPIPPEFWDEWDAICEAEAEARLNARVKAAEHALLEIPPDPLEVWGVMMDGSAFRLSQDRPATHEVWLAGTVPATGIFRHFELRRPDGEVLAQFEANVGQRALAVGDTLQVSLDAEQLVKFLVT